MMMQSYLCKDSLSSMAMCPARLARECCSSMTMTILELVQPRPDWLGAPQIALTRPPGVPERRSGEDPWKQPTTDRPRRISDDLAWFRDAMDEPDRHGLRPPSAPAKAGGGEPADPR